MLDMSKKLKDFQVLLEAQAAEVEKINYSISQQLREVKLMLLDKINYFSKKCKDIAIESEKRGISSDEQASEFMVYCNMIVEFQEAIKIIDNIRF